jgi:hypothetical protein
LTKSSPARAYWGVDASLSYVSGHDILIGGAGILDTGTTLLLLASDAFARYKTSTGAEMDAHTGLLALSKANYHKIKDLVFTIGGRDFKLSPDGQIWPTYLNKALGGSDDKVYLVAGDVSDFFDPRLALETVADLNAIVGFAFWSGSRLHRWVQLPPAVLHRVRYHAEQDWSRRDGVDAQAG